MATGFSCSFCGKSQAETGRLISGPRVFICTECVALCNAILAERPTSESGAMERVRGLAARAAPTKVSVLIQGSRGVGKAFLARTIHTLSGRSGSFVTLDCDAPEERLAVDLLGALEAADAGTVLLKDVGRLPPVAQATLLRALEARSIVTRGARRPRGVDVRTIASTRDDLEAGVARGSFDRDLFFRLNVMTMEVPPLRDRIDEVAPIAFELLEDLRRESGHETSPRLTPDAIERLRRYPWPGNVSQLREVLRRALLLSDGAEISVAHLTVEMPAPFARRAIEFSEALIRRRTRAERDRMIAALLGGERRRPRGPDKPSPRTPRPTARELRCSICEDSEKSARLMIHGLYAVVCDRCVEDAQGITHARRPADLAAPADDLSGAERSDAACAFCGKSAKDVAHLVGVEDHQLICDGCLDAYDKLLGKRFAALGSKGELFTLRTVYPASKIDAVTAAIREELSIEAACRIVILVDGGDVEAAYRLSARLRLSLSDVADLREASPAAARVALTLIAERHPSGRA